MTCASQNRFFSMGEVYDRMAPYLVPQYDFLQDELLRILGIEDEDAVVVDLGAGSGRLLEKVLTRNPSAQCYWVDFSPDFLNVARKRLSRFGGRVRFVQSAIEDNWEDQLHEAPGYVVSMSAIHHLDRAEKTGLYRRCFDVLPENGWFMNVDEAKTVYSDAYVNSLLFWVKHVERGEALIPEEEGHFYREWNVRFADWRKRNVEGWQGPKTTGDDLHESFVEQLEWLHDAGFRNVDVFFKYHLWCAMGGQKTPA